MQASLTVQSAVYRDGETIPQSAVFDAFGCTGGNQSPDLAWSGAPDGTKSFAITIWDPDAPTTIGWVHWIVFDIPAGVTSLPAGAGTPGAHPAVGSRASPILVSAATAVPVRRPVRRTVTS